MRKNIFCLLGFLFLVRSVFAAIPIQDETLRGAAAAEARFRLLASAESCLGVPYRYAGIDRGGLDCSGLVYLSFREGLKLSIPRSSEGIYGWAEKIPDAELEPGDLVFFVTTGPGVSHLGIYSGDGWFIHSASEGPRTGVIYSRLDEAYWKRTYLGAGRALPCDSEAVRIMAAARSRGAPRTAASDVKPQTAAAATEDTRNAARAGYTENSKSAGSAAPPPVWMAEGFFTGMGAAWTWGGFIQGAPSVFRGLSVLLTAGYKWPNYRVGLELRPEWDRALGVFRLPLTLAIGTDKFQFFAGPAYTFGEPALGFSGRERRYKGGGTLFGEVGFQAAFPPIRIARGGLSFYGELAWQPYHWEAGEKFSFKPDITANMRLSTGVRYLWRIGK